VGPVIHLEANCVLETGGKQGVKGHVEDATGARLQQEALCRSHANSAYFRFGAILVNHFGRHIYRKKMF